MNVTKHKIAIKKLCTALGDSAILSRQARRVISRGLSRLHHYKIITPSASTCSCRVPGRLPIICLSAQAISPSLRVQHPKKHEKNQDKGNIWRSTSFITFCLVINSAFVKNKLIYIPSFRFPNSVEVMKDRTRLFLLKKEKYLSL